MPRREHVLQMPVQRPRHVDLLPALCASLDNVEVPHHRPPLLVAHLPRRAVTDPGVHASPPRVHPQDVLEPKVLPQRRVDHLDRHRREGPALAADVRLVAARADVVVVRQIDIEAELLGDRLEGRLVAEGLAVAGVGGVDGADLESGGDYADDILSKAGPRQYWVSSVPLASADRGAARSGGGTYRSELG